MALTGQEIDQLEQSGALSPDYAAQLRAQMPKLEEPPAQQWSSPPFPDPASPEQATPAAWGVDPNQPYRFDIEQPPPRPQLPAMANLQMPRQAPALQMGPDFGALGRGAAAAGRRFGGELGSVQNAYADAQQARGEAMAREADAQIAKNDARADTELQNLRILREQDAADEAKRQAERKSIEEGAAEARRLDNEAADAKIDPGRKMRPLGNKILAALAIGLGEVGAAITGRGSGGAANIIRAAIDDDIDAQRAELANKRQSAAAKWSELGVMRQRYGEDELARLALRARNLSYAEKEAEAAALRFDNPILKERAKQAVAELQAESAKAYGDFIDHKAGLDMQGRQLQLSAAAQQADAAASAAKAGGKDLSLPGYAGQAPTQEIAKKAMDVKGTADSVLRMISDLRNFVQGPNGVGRELFPTDVAKRAQGMAMGLQLKIKEAEALGQLDKDAIRIMDKMVPSDPTQLNQGAVREALRALEDNIKGTTQAKLAAYGYRPLVNETAPAQGQ